MNDSGGRWWEVRSEAQPDDQSGYPELGTDSRGRTRPERSLSAGADLADEPRHPARAFLWPVVSVVAAIALILSVGYVVSASKPTSSNSALPSEPAGRSDVAPDVGAKQDAGVTPSGPAAPLDDPPAADGDSPAPAGRPAAVPRGPADNAQGRTAAAPSDPAAAPNVSSGGPTKDTGHQPSWQSTLSKPAPASAPKPQLDGPAPPAPGPQQTGQPAPGSSGNCRTYDNADRYLCFVDENERAPVYRPGMRTPDRYVSLPAGAHAHLFRCQSDGSRYSVGNRTNHWWAWWIENSGDEAWLPVVYLTRGRNDTPAGLPICAGPSSGTSTPTTTTPSSPPTGPTEVTMVDQKTGRCLDSNEQGQVHTVQCNVSDDHKWDTPGDGTIRDKQTKWCLDSNEQGNAYAMECNDGDDQKWVLK